MAGGQQRGLVLVIAGGQRAYRLVAAEQDRVEFPGDVIGRDRQVQGVVTPGGVVEVDRAGLAVVVQDVLQAQVGVDQPVTGRVVAEAGEHGVDPPGRLG